MVGVVGSSPIAPTKTSARAPFDSRRTGLFSWLSQGGLFSTSAAMTALLESAAPGTRRSVRACGSADGALRAPFVEQGAGLGLRLVDRRGSAQRVLAAVPEVDQVLG